jgi:hypothetical protein
MDWLRTAIGGRSFLELAFVVALGFGLWVFANALGDLVVSTIAQVVNESDVSAFGPFGLTFKIGNTVIDYGRPLSVLVAIVLLLAGFTASVKWRERKPR